MTEDLKISWTPELKAGVTDRSGFFEAYCGMPAGSFRGLVHGAPCFEVDELPEEDGAA